MVGTDIKYETDVVIIAAQLQAHTEAIKISRSPNTDFVSARMTLQKIYYSDVTL